MTARRTCIFEPLDFIARLAALVPKPRVNLTPLSMGVFVGAKLRARVTPAQAEAGGGQRDASADLDEPRTPAERRAAMTWAQRLKRVFNIDIETCQRFCAGAGRIIACIEDPEVIAKILTHLAWTRKLLNPKHRGARRAPGAARANCSRLREITATSTLVAATSAVWLRYGSGPGLVAANKKYAATLAGLDLFAHQHVGLMVFASQRDGRAQVPVAAIGRFSWRKGLLYSLYWWLGRAAQDQHAVIAPLNLEPHFTSPARSHPAFRKLV